MDNIFLKKTFIFILFALICLPQSVFALTSFSNSVTISAQVGSVLPPWTGGGGGGGTATENLTEIPTTVNFSGMAYPFSKIFVLKDKEIIATTTSDPGAKFLVSVSNNFNTGTYVFSVYGEDSNGRRSSVFSIPLLITKGTTVDIGNIFLSPTIAVDKNQVKKGDNLVIFGLTAPKSEVVISVHSNPELFFKTISNTIGAYLYNLDTSMLELGEHETKSKSILSNNISLYTNLLRFSVNSGEIKQNCSLLRGDANCDNLVNIIDFSITAFWYKKDNSPKKLDLNNDGKVNLIDFSIMAFNWTG
jgi:hypothetical protein